MAEHLKKTDEIMLSDFLLPIGKAKIEKEGKDVSIILFSRQVGNELIFYPKMGFMSRLLI
jgi:pyruvate dehydrogenase E1 component beta subunit